MHTMHFSVCLFFLGYIFLLFFFYCAFVHLVIKHYTNIYSKMTLVFKLVVFLAHMVYLFGFFVSQAVVVYECLSEWGQILCSICPNPKLVITGGLSTAICVWENGTSKEKAKSLTLKQVHKQYM